MQFKEQFMRLWWIVMLIASLCGCGHVAAAQERAGQNSLGIVGYNYTDRSIDSFSVDGQGGGNIYISSLTSGGGGIVCCVLYRPAATIKTVRIRWQAGGCYFSEQSPLSKQMFDTLHWFYKEQEAPVEVLASLDAKYMEVHFYPDGSIKAAITAKISAPRLSLDDERKEKNPYPRCPNDRKPKT